MQRTRTARPIAQAKRKDLRPLVFSLGVLSLCLAVLATSLHAEEDTITTHGYSFYGDLTYPEDYPHFAYVNPNAPKGGEISIATLGTFDSMHPYTRKGRAGALSTVMYESLLGEGVNTDAPADVYSEYYGLLAERLEFDQGRNWVIFYIRPEARFSDGSPVTAYDIEFSHNLLLDEGLKSYGDAVRKRIPKVEVLDDHRIKFYFTEGISRRSLIDQVGFVPAWSKKWYEENNAGLDESRLDVSPGSGAYMIETVDVNRRVAYKRNPDYWGKDLPFNVGRNNFDRIRIEYFGDDTAAFEGLKAGEYTFRLERDSKRWATGYESARVANGQIVKKSIPNGSPAAPSGMIFNLGKPQLKDRRVRQALALAYNFEWSNESLQYGLFKQRASFSQDTEVMASGTPEGLELEYLQSLGDLVPAAMLNEPAIVPHTSKAARLQDRRNTRAAMKLLDEAGWPVGDDGIRRNAAGETLSINFLLSGASPSTLVAVIENYVSNVEKMGVTITLEKVDTAQYTARERDRDYDMVHDQYAAFLGTGTGLAQYYGSKSAEFSLFNPAGLASPLVDEIITASLLAQTRAQEVAWVKALDRALRYEFIMIPMWYKADHWVAYYDQYEHPENMPAFSLGYLDFWWYNQDKADALRAAGALR